MKLCTSSPTTGKEVRQMTMMGREGNEGPILVRNYPKRNVVQEVKKKKLLDGCF